MTLERIPRYLAGHDIPWLTTARESAFQRFAAHGLPTRREEEWKYTDVSMIGKRTSLAPDNIPPDPSSEARLFAWALAQENAHLMVFVNGHYSSELSALGELPPGVRLESLADLLDGPADLPEMLFDQQHENTIFAALNNALATDGAVLNLAAGAVLEKPLYLLFIASGHGTASTRAILFSQARARALRSSNIISACWMCTILPMRCRRSASVLMPKCTIASCCRKARTLFMLPEYTRNRQRQPLCLAFVCAGRAPWPQRHHLASERTGLPVHL